MVETLAAAVAGVSPGTLPPAPMASGRAMAIPAPRSPRPTNPAAGIPQERAAEPATGNDRSCPKHADGAEAGDEPITHQATKRYSTQEDAQGHSAEGFCSSQRLRDVYGGPIQAGALGQREAERQSPKQSYGTRPIAEPAPQATLRPILRRFLPHIEP